MAARTSGVGRWFRFSLQQSRQAFLVIGCLKVDNGMTQLELVFWFAPCARHFHHLESWQKIQCGTPTQSLDVSLLHKGVLRACLVLYFCAILIDLLIPRAWKWFSWCIQQPVHNCHFQGSSLGIWHEEYFSAKTQACCLLMRNWVRVLPVLKHLSLKNSFPILAW